MRSASGVRCAEHERRDGIPALVLVAMIVGATAVVMFFTSPTDGDFAWSDAPRHALNGVFIYDFALALPFADARQWAIDYYLQYPALTVLFYPPAFSAALAGSYSLLGFSHPVAQGTVAVFHALLGLGAYRLARTWLAPSYALGTALILMAAPEISMWGRQVMLDIPAYAVLLWSGVAFQRYLDQPQPKRLYATALLLVAALYFKQTPIFFPGAVAVGLALRHGRGFLARREVWLAFGGMAVLLAPLAVLQMHFGEVNVGSVMGSARADLSRWSPDAWLYYAKVLPDQLGWPVPILAGVYLLGCLPRPDWRLPRASFGFLLAWFALGYLLFSFVMVREPRHDLMALFPLVLFAMLGARQVAAALPGKIGGRWGGAFAVALGLGYVAYACAFLPVPYASGYKEVAVYVSEHAPKNSRILFSGYRDGSFVFNMRAQARDDLDTVRADKLFLRLAIERERGVTDLGLSAAEIESYLRRMRVRYVVVQTGFWSDLPSLAALAELARDRSRFAERLLVPVETNFPSSDHELAVYEYLGDIAETGASLSYDMVGIGRRFSEGEPGGGPTTDRSKSP